MVWVCELKQQGCQGVLENNRKQAVQGPRRIVINRDDRNRLGEGRRST
jgi:hypothetical protein